MFHQFHRSGKAGVPARDAARLKGPVMKVMAITYQPKLKEGLIEAGPLADDLTVYDDLNHIITFNKDGDLTHELLYGTFGEWEERVYEADNRQTENKQYKDGHLVKQIGLTYNAQGQHTHTIITTDGRPAVEDTTEYDEAGAIVRHTHENHQQPTASTIRTHSYNELGRCILLETHKKHDGSLQSRSSIIHTDTGKVSELTREHCENDSEDMNYREVYFFNEHDDTIGSDTYNLQGELIRTLRYGHEYQYDAKGKRIEADHKEDEQFTFEDKLDAHGNWTWRLVYEADVPRFVMVRQLQYEGEAEHEMVHPLRTVKEKDAADEALRTPRHKDMKAFTDDELRFIFNEDDLGSDQFPYVRYYVVMFKYAPSMHYFYDEIEAHAVLRTCERDFGAKKIYTCCDEKKGATIMRQYVLSFPMYPGYLLYATQLDELNDNDYLIPLSIAREDESVYISGFHVARPPEDSPLHNGFFEMEIRDMMSRLTLKKRPSLPKISLIQVHNGHFALMERTVKDNFTIRDLDVNYGHGFEQFHNDLMARFNTSSKGLVLFHGQPGTGKTYYIRHLLRQMAIAKKTVIYMPPNMVDHLTEPGFMTFVTSSIHELSRNDKHCVLLIEDAEPLLAKRQEGVRIQGVTNLLNMTDGLLNDMLNLQIICTFNVDLHKLDSALLRPGRLLARKEFKPLSELDANLLGQRLGIKHHFHKPVSLGEIYAMLQDQNTLIHDVDPDQGASNAIDDLL